MELAKIKPYFLTDKNVLDIEKKYDSKYIGYWCIKNIDETWSNIPVDIFYQENPNRELGHTNYFGIFKTLKGMIICNAESAFKSNIVGILEDDLVYVSRFRHDFVITPKKCVIDGGRDYLKISGEDVKLVKVIVENGKFSFEFI